MTVPPSDTPSAAPPPTAGAARVHRGLAILFLALGVVAFFLAGLGAFGEGFEAHQGVGSLMVLLSLILLVLALAGRRDALQASGALFLLMVVQMLLGQVGEDVPVLGALHPVNALLILFVASLAAAGRPLPRGRAR